MSEPIILQSHGVVDGKAYLHVLGVAKLVIRREVSGLAVDVFQTEQDIFNQTEIPVQTVVVFNDELGLEDEGV